MRANRSGPFEPSGIIDSRLKRQCCNGPASGNGHQSQANFIMTGSLFCAPVQLQVLLIQRQRHVPPPWSRALVGCMRCSRLARFRRFSQATDRSWDHHLWRSRNLTVSAKLAASEYGPGVFSDFPGHELYKNAGFGRQMLFMGKDRMNRDARRAVLVLGQDPDKLATVQCGLNRP